MLDSYSLKPRSSRVWGPAVHLSAIYFSALVAKLLDAGPRHPQLSELPKGPIAR